MTVSNPHTPEHVYDAVVIGAGPSGLATATAMARSGASVLIVDKHPGLSRFPKATGLRPRTMEILRGWGLESAILDVSQAAQLTMRVTPMLTVPGTELSMGLPSEADLEPVTPCRIAVCPQDRLEAILLDHLLARGGEVRFGTCFHSLGEDDDGVRVCLQTPDGVSVVRARYVVAADGAHSAVRDHLGIPWAELGSEGDHLGVLFTADLSSVVPVRPHVLTMTVAPGLEGMFVATGESNRWIYDFEWHPENGQSRDAWTPELVTDRIRAAAGVPDLDVSLIGVFPWDFGAAVAGRQRQGRVFLVGDAAHRTTPRGATGMNTGIADGYNLGWKLAWVARGWADERLLASFEEERAGVGRANAQASLVTSVGAPPADALALDFGDVLESSVVAGTGPLVGHRAPHVWIGPGRSTIDLFDGRLTVLTGREGPHWREECSGMAITGLPILAYSLGQELADVEDQVAARYAIGPRGCVLVRPDGYVAWASDGTDLAVNGLRRAVAASLGRR
jgi:putative polyketide hydroxylase